MRKPLSVVAAALALIATLVPTSSVSAQTTPISVQISAGLGREVPGFTARPMVPVIDGIPTVQVHSGDVIRVKGAVILLPEGQDPEAWRQDVATDPGDPWALFWADPDADLPGVNAPSHLNARSFSPTNFDCGFTADDPCEFDGSNKDLDTGPINSGDQGEWYVRISGQPNNTFYAVAQIPYGSVTDFRIQIVNPNAETTTQVQLDEAKKTFRAQDRATALSLMESLNTVTKYEEDGRMVYEVYAGYDEGPVSLLAYFPQKVRIPRGATVRYRFDRATLEPHTATFPFKAGVKAARTSFVPACDPDGSGEGPDTQANFSEEGPPCPEGDQFELDLAKRLTAQIGDGVYPGAPRYESSGLRGAIVPEGVEDLAGGTDAWDVLFNKRSDGFRYVCALHGGFMNGTVKVR